MKKDIRNAVSGMLIVALFGMLFAGCSKEAARTTPPTTPVTEIPIPENYQWASYESGEDAIFLPQDIYSEDMLVSGVVCGDVTVSNLDITDRTDTAAVVVKGEYGKCYEVKIPADASRVCAVTTRKDPGAMTAGERIFFDAESTLCNKADLADGINFMYTCREAGEYLVICTDSSAPIYIGERTILADTDTKDDWYVPETVGSIRGDCTLGNYEWSAEEVVDNLYEPVRQRHPGYITRSVIGTDQTGKYNMYGYVYAPENYEITLFITGGMHATEETAYFALAKIMQMIADATPEDQLLFTLRHKVRFVVIPIINVWGVDNGHIRQNSAGVDLNRDFGELSQKESQNVIAFFEQYAEDVCVAMDFHNAGTKGLALWFNFINYTDNAVANYKTTNHMYHRYMELGYAQKETDMSHIPGSYVKSDKYLEGRIWNGYGVPTITVEYAVNDVFPLRYFSECMTLGVETYLNFIIQNSLYYLNQ